jgi:hypothetical protein
MATATESDLPAEVASSTRSQRDKTHYPTDSLVSVSLEDADVSQDEGDFPAQEAPLDPRQSSPEFIPQPELDVKSSNRRLTVVTGNFHKGEGEPAPEEETEEEVQQSDLHLRTRPRADSAGSAYSADVDWDKLQRTEELEPRDEGSDEVGVHNN